MALLAVARLVPEGCYCIGRCSSIISGGDPDVEGWLYRIEEQRAKGWKGKQLGPVPDSYRDGELLGIFHGAVNASKEKKNLSDWGGMSVERMKTNSAGQILPQPRFLTRGLEPTMPQNWACQGKPGETLPVSRFGLGLALDLGATTENVHP